ncbi:hypothetical protein [Pseudonocardia sp. D17]|uniref:hypothetical protein n=1 Tax=Pseudonocardia sp. D17 TaxID=882661 RepID=UPI002B3F4CC6|nr:hypothetical protein PSD17_45470 [Pseudonocardia sp. D17]
MTLLRRRPVAPPPAVADAHRAALEAVSAAHRLHVPRSTVRRSAPAPGPRRTSPPGAPADDRQPWAAVPADHHGASSSGTTPARRPHDPPDAASGAVDAAGATSLACAFALDLTSWDEDNPDRRAAVLARYLPGVVDVERLGWDGRGRQRSETVIPGALHHLDATHVRVDVRVRVTPFVRLPGVAALHPVPEHEPTGGAVLSAAPAPVAPGWVACDSEWVRLRVPVACDGAGGLVVDLGAARRDGRGAC